MNQVNKEALKEGPRQGTTLSEMVNTPGGRVLLLQYAIEEMQECLGTLSENRPFVRAVFCAFDDAGMLTQERLKKRSKLVEEKVMRREPPFDKPLFLRDLDDPGNWEKVTVWPAGLFLEQAAAAT